jgi:hypothetical protein
MTVQKIPFGTDGVAAAVAFLADHLAAQSTW